MPHPEPPAPAPAPQIAGLSREQKLHQLHEELKALHAQLEYLRLMMKLRQAKA
ncbi:MAG: hypothetical protein U1E89_21620 [Burkholderiaceae bacterium]